MMDPIMSISEYNVMESLCRCCLAQDVSMKPLFVKEEEINYLPYQVVSQMCDVVICPNDNLPSHVCTDCLDKIHSLGEFRSRVLDSQRILREHFHKVGSNSATNVIKSLTDLLTQKFYTCAVCSKKFTTELNLIRHGKRCNNDNLVGTAINKDNVESQESVLFDSFVTDGKTIDKNSLMNSIDDFDGDNCAIPQTRKSKRRCKKRKNDDPILARYKKSLKVVKGVFICDHCDFDFKELNHLKEHLRLLEQSGGASVCMFCCMKYEDKQSLVEHIQDAHDTKRPYLCNLCSNTFGKWNTLQVHVRSRHTKEKTIACPRCPKMFLIPRDLRRHLNSHDSPYHCNVCDKAFKYKFSLAIHKKRHTDMKVQSCAECNQTFSAEYKLIRHMKTMHSGKSFPCPDCGKIFTQNTHLQRHRLVHRDKEARHFRCDVCSKTFNHKHHLANHEKTHTQIRPFLCNICGKGFIQKVHLKNHLNSHNSKKPLVCEYCPQTFMYRSRLKVHVKTTHLDIKMAPKSFQIKAKIEKDINVEKENGVVCEVCQSKFSNITQLKKHIKTHTNASVESCEVCDKKITKKKMPTHMKMHDNKKKNSNKSNKVNSQRAVVMGEDENVLNLNLNNDILSSVASEENVTNVAKDVTIIGNDNKDVTLQSSDANVPFYLSIFPVASPLPTVQLIQNTVGDANIVIPQQSYSFSYVFDSSLQMEQRTDLTDVISSDKEV